MSYLLVDELGMSGSTTMPYQVFKNTSGRAIHIVHIRPHIYKHLAPSGSFYLEVQNYDGVKIAASNALTAAEISADDYYHGYIRFDLNLSLPPSTTDTSSWYRLQLKSTGYSFSESAYIGWCVNFEDYDLDVDYTIAGNLDRPFGVQFWELRNKDIKRVVL